MSLRINKKSTKLLIVLIGLLLAIAFDKIVFAQFISNRVINTASATTILLGYESDDNSEFFPRGSGVIINKQAQDLNDYWNYIVLTVAHSLDSNSDKEINDNDDIRGKYQIKVQTSQEQLQPYFVENYERIKSNQLGNLDLALLFFSSQNDYFTAPFVDDINSIEIGEVIYVSGFPQSSKGFRIDEGVLQSVDEPSLEDSKIPFTGGYSLKYKPSDSNGMDYGMSGSPIFNRNGYLIGIHGRQDHFNKYKLGIGIDVLLDSISN
jgi:S1-C subfamily serine protease